MPQKHDNPARRGAAILLVALMAIVALLAPVRTAQGHEVLPTVADMTVIDGFLVFDVQANLEGFLAGVDLSQVQDIDASAAKTVYDGLRQLPPEDLDQRFRAAWPQMAAQIVLRTDVGDLVPDLSAVSAAATGNVELVRQSTFQFRAALPTAATTVQVGWAAPLGILVVRQQGVEAPYDGYLTNGAISPPIALPADRDAGLLRRLFNALWVWGR